MALLLPHRTPTLSAADFAAFVHSIYLPMAANVTFVAA